MTNDTSLSTAAVYLHRLESIGIQPGAVASYLLYISQSRGRNEDVDCCVDASDVATEFGINYDAAEQLLELISVFGVVTFVDSISSEVKVNKQVSIRFMHFIEQFSSACTPKTQELLADNRLHDISLHYAVPDGFQRRSADLMATLTQLVDNAEQSILIVSPFINQFGVEIFIERLSRATNRGVTVTLLTRDTESGDNETQVQEIRHAIVDEGKEQRLTVYDYGGDSKRLHAKSLVVDGELAYIGSANMTSYSLREAIEIGVMIEGPVVDELLEFFEDVQRSPDSTRI